MIMGWTADNGEAQGPTVGFPSIESKLLISENILIFNASPKENGHFTSFDGFPLGPVDRGRLLGGSKAISRWQNTLAIENANWEMLTVIGYLQKISNANSYAVADNDGWRFSVVIKCVFTDGEGIAVRKITFGFDKNIGAFDAWNMFGGSLSSFSSLFGGSQTHANKPKLHVEQNKLTYADHNEPKRKKTSSILGEPRRPSEFIIWQLGFFAAGFGLLGSYGLCRLGIWPGRRKKHSHRKNRHSQKRSQKYF